MRKAKEPKPAFQMYVAYRGVDYPEPSIVIGTEVRRRHTGIRVMPLCRIVIETGDAGAINSGLLCRVQPDQALAQADTFLGIVVKVERFLKLRKAAIPNN